MKLLHSLYLAQFWYTSSGLLASSNGTKSPTVVGDVYIYPSAKVHPITKIDLNSAYVRVDAGVRLIDCIILDDAEIQGDEDYKTKLGITILGKYLA
ncbi:hypothetical protein Tco_1084866 [Tanacetum coccineum]